MSPTPQRRATAAGALVAAAAMIAVGIQTGTASADATASQAPTAAAARPNPGKATVKLSPSQRAELIAGASTGTAQAAKSLGLGSQEKLLVRDVVKDADGTTHTTYERTYAGLPVLGGDLTVHAKGGTQSVTKATNKTIKVADTTPAVTVAAAEKQAVSAAKAEGSKETKASRGARKVVWAATGSPVLAYETVVGGLQHDGTPNELHVVTNAETGAKIAEWQGIETGTGNTQYSGQVTLGTTQSGSTYNLTDAGRGSHKTYNLNRGTSGTGTLFSGPDDIWGNGAASNLETAGADAHYGAALTWDYYKNVHGRNGLRNDGVAPYSRVHYGNAYVNAFWQDSCFCMTYGDGEGNNKPLTSIDVAAHEMTHGLTSVTGNMTYSGESGGLNEATSDIMAAAVEFYANNAQDVGDYLVGEKIDIRGNGTPLRYMDKPSKDGSSKDAWYSGIGSIDVHYSSGPANHWFYLASEGSGAKVVNGVSYDSPTSDGLPVTAIGRAAAEKIWFRALTVGYFKSNTNYADARVQTLKAAADLYGQGSVTYNNAANAWAAINVGARIPNGVTVTNPGPQSTVTGSAVNLQVQASSSNAGALAYAATGLPTGLSINSSTGLITGTAGTAGTYNVTVTVTDSANQTGTASFVWTVGTTQPNVFENTTDYTISDNATVESPITVNRSGNAPAALKVDVNIVHTYVGDLVVDLVAPDGSVYNLRNRTGGSADNIVQQFTVNASSEVAQGVWKLRVRDAASLDTGYINSWKLTF